MDEEDQDANDDDTKTDILIQWNFVLLLLFTAFFYRCANSFYTLFVMCGCVSTNANRLKL